VIAQSADALYLLHVVNYALGCVQIGKVSYKIVMYDGLGEELWAEEGP